MSSEAVSHSVSGSHLDLVMFCAIGLWVAARYWGRHGYRASNPEALFYLDRPAGRYVPQILSASEIESSQLRNWIFADIAKQTDLTQVEQEFLVEVLVVCDGLREDKASVVWALIGNPSVAWSVLDTLPLALADMDLDRDSIGAISAELHHRAVSMAVAAG
jgi:hypothetical protein